MTDVPPELEEVTCYTTQQVAKLLKVTTESVRRWLNDGDLKAIKINGFWRVRHPDLVKYLEERYGSTDDNPNL